MSSKAHNIIHVIAHIFYLTLIRKCMHESLYLSAGYIHRAKLRSVFIQHFAQNSRYMSLNAINATAPSSQLHLCP